jgi:hypothetical protein
VKKALVAVIVIIVLCSLLVVALFLHTAPAPTPSPSPSSSPTPTPTLSPSPSPTPTLTPTPTVEPDALKTAVTNAINFFEDSPQPSQSNQLYALMMLDVMYRRFGVTEFADALQQYDQAIDTHPQDAAIMRVFRRIADHDNQLYPGDLQSVTYDIDRLTVPALYCDRYELPDDYPAQLEQAANLGEYMLTHTVLSWIWIQENGCTLQLPDGFIQNVYQATAALINNDSVVDDLELEAAAFLYLAGQGALVDNSFVNLAISAQNYDGGWLTYSNEPGESNWHATAVGLLFLLHVEYPADSYPPMLAPASP